MLRGDPAHVRIGGTCAVERTGRGITLNGLPLDRFELPAAFRVPGLAASRALDQSEHIRLALEQLHAEHRFERIEFPASDGLGFRAIQAKRAGLAFDDVVLAVRLDSCSAWQREAEQRWPSGFEEVETDFAEQFAFEHADERLTPDAGILAFVRGKGWHTGVPCPLPNPSPGGRGASISSPSPPGGGGRGRGHSVSPLVTIAIAQHNLGRYLPETLTSLVEQTYPDIEVIVIDDGSTDAASLATFADMEARYPHWRFLRQANAGIGATRNRCLELARGEFIIPVDADNLARPDMVERFVTAIRRNPDLAAMTCYFLAFPDGAGNPPRRFLHACRPAGGPHILAGIRNVYGDANAIFRTAALRAVGGYETDRGTSCEDWEAFVKLAHAGERIGVVPDHLFYYRHLANGFSRRTNWYANHQRVLRHFTGTGGMSPAEAAALWTALLGFHQRLEQLESAPLARRHRIADAFHSLLKPLLRLMRRTVRPASSIR